MSNKFNNEERASTAVSKILRETKENTLVWSINLLLRDYNFLGVEETLLGNYYSTTIKDKSLRIYKVKTRYFTDYNEYMWVDVCVLEFYNFYNGATEWRFPDTNATSDLYEAVMTQTARMDEFFDDYLEE